MELMLLIITIAALAIAGFLGIAAWGMWREERDRSAARVAALAAAAAADEPPAAHTPIQPARVTEPKPVPKPAPWSATPEWRRLPRIEPTATAPERMADSFLSTTAPASSRQRALGIAAAVLFAAIVTGGYFTLYGNGDSATGEAAAGAAASAPLELISLRHERQDGALAITGLVRNPADGVAQDKLAAVAFLFDREGAFITSARAGVDFTQLAPGDESPFVIRLDAPARVARYRVSFRTEAGLVPHIDRRGQEPIARDLP
jgi:hypothetical protein